MKKIIIILILFIVMLSFINADLTTSNQLYYSLDDADLSGSDPIDIASYTYNGTTTGATTGATGLINEAFDYDGNDDYITFADLTGLLDPDDTFTINMWVYYEDADYGAFRTLFELYEGDDTGLLCYLHDTLDFMDCGFRGGSTGQRMSIAQSDFNGWTMVTITNDGSELDVFLNTTAPTITDNAYGPGGSGTTQNVLGAQYNFGATSFEGRIEEFAIWSRELNSTEISELYNSGAGYNPYSAPVSNDTNFSITAVSDWDASSITNFSALINGTLYNTTDGTLETNISSNSTSLYNITISSNNWFNKTYNNYNVSSNLQAELIQSDIKLEVRELFTNNTVSNVSVYLNGSLAFNTTSYFSNIYPNADDYTVTSILDNSGSEIYHVTSENFTVSALDNKTVIVYVHAHFLNITATNIITSATITNFTVNIVSYNISDNRTLNTTNGLISIPVIHNTYNVTIIDTDGYAVFDADGNYYANNNSVIINTDKSINFELYAYNSINFSFYNDDNILLDNINISLSLENNISTINYTITDGWVFVENLTTGNYTAIYDAEGYAEHQYFFTVTESSTTSISLFLVNATAVLYKYILKDENDDPVTQAFIRLQQKINGTFSTINECKTNSNGECYMYILESTSIVYRELVIYNAQTIKTTDESQIISLSSEEKIITIRVDLGENLFNEIQRRLGVYGLVTVDEDNNLTNFTYIDSYNSVSGGCLRVDRRNILDNEFTTITQSCLSTTSGDITINFTPYLINKSEFLFIGFVNYTDSNYILDSKSYFFRPRNNNQSEDDLLFFTLLLFVGVSFATVWIRNYTAQIVLNIGVIIIMFKMGLNLLGIPLIMGFLSLGIFITWRRKNVTNEGG